MLNDSILIPFFLEELSVAELQEQVQEELEREEEASYHYTFQDNDSIQHLSPEDLLRLCTAVRQGELQPEALPLIAQAISDSEKFEWEDERVSEVLYFWLEESERYPPEQPENMERFARWLTGEEALPEA